MILTAQNYKSGVLLDDEWMAGIVDEMSSQVFRAFIINYLTGETIQTECFPILNEGLNFLNSFTEKRQWSYQSFSCSGGDCEKGDCGKICSMKPCGL